MGNPSGYSPVAQLARAPALQAGGQGFDSLILHIKPSSLGAIEVIAIEVIQSSFIDTIKGNEKKCHIPGNRGYMECKKV